MTKEEIVGIAKTAHGATGDKYLDDLFSRVDTATYYRFLYQFVKQTRPALVAELGSYRGGSTAHLAATGVKVVAVEPEPQPEFAAVLKRYPNIDWRKDVSLSKAVLDSVADRSVDICFIDTDHKCAQVVAEHWAWLPKLKTGGVMLFDDISFDDSMREGWDIIRTWHDPCYVSLPDLHHSGFGAIFIP